MFFIFSSAAVFLLDRFTKILVQRYFVEGTSIPIVPKILHLTFYRNSGAAFGILKHQRLAFILITIAVMAAIVYFYFQVPGSKKWARFALALQFGGAAGNLVDRIATGYVVDFIDFRIWPVFNFADSAMVIGTAILVWEILRWREDDGGEKVGNRVE